VTARGEKIYEERPSSFGGEAGPDCANAVDDASITNSHKDKPANFLKVILKYVITRSPEWG
jgi:hypothetical protein